MSNKTVLQLGAGPLMVHSIRLIKEAGIKVHALDRNPQAPGFKIADGYAAINITDEKGVEDYARKVKADAILAVNEFGVLSAAKASQKLGLIGMDPDTALRCLDKGLMRERWQEFGLSQPKFKVITSPDQIAEAIKEVGYPVILKPAMNCGSRGVSILRGEQDLDFAVDFAKSNCTNGRFVVEEFISGTEMTIEGLVKNGKPQILAKSDKEAQKHERYCVAMALNYPAKFNKSILDQVDQLVINAAKALGIKNGALHCEVMVNDNGVFLVEMGGRPGGGHIFGQIAEAASGVCMPVALAKILLGLDVDIKPKSQKGACYKFFAPPQGVFESAKGVDEAKKLPGILDFGFEMKRGTVVGAISGDADRPGFVVAGGKDRNEAIKNANKAIAHVSYVMSPIKEKKQ